jgi:hypothetical protein
MKVTIEQSAESRDFGEYPTLKITAYKPRDVFRLGVIFMECIAMNTDIVQGETLDGSGMFIRVPLKKDLTLDKMGIS